MSEERKTIYLCLAQIVVDGFNSLTHSLLECSKIKKYFIWYTFGTYF